MRIELSDVLKDQNEGLEGACLLDVLNDFHKNIRNRDKVIVAGADYPFVESLVGFSDEVVYDGKCALYKNGWPNFGRFLLYNPKENLIAELTLYMIHIGTNRSMDRFRFTYNPEGCLTMVYKNSDIYLGNQERVRKLKLGGMIQ